MNTEPDLLSNLSKQAFHDFFLEEIRVILDDVSERSLCSRLAMHFERHMKISELRGYYADTEYNRKQNGEVKTILDGEMKKVAITCDLIIHSRGEKMTQDNLIAIEMAKPNKSDKEFTNDRNRLRALTKKSYDRIWSADGKAHPEHVCGYVLGFYLIVDRAKRIATVEMYANGAQLVGSEEISF